MIYAKKVKRKCSVRGCKNTECFAISKSREIGNSVIICKSCLQEALGAVGEIDPKTKKNIPVVNRSSSPSLFFYAKALGTDAAETKNDDVPPVTDNGQGETTAPQTEDGKEPDNGSDVPPVDGTPDADGVTPSVAGVTPDTKDVPPATTDGRTEETDTPADITEFTCPVCDRTFDSEKGLNTHLRYCKAEEKAE